MNSKGGAEVGNLVLGAFPGLKVFWTAYDPLDLASDSIDPLGFMAGYVALADRILPGFTTITTVPRYAGMLCCAVKHACEAVDGSGGRLSDRPKQTLGRIKAFERAWALACGLAEQSSKIGGGAAAGLRGIRSVRHQLAQLARKGTISLDFELLANQERYGGIGAYAAFLEALHLADMNTLTLSPRGEDLAKEFPQPSSMKLPRFSESIRVSVEDLRAWGAEAHVGVLTKGEGRVLRDALRRENEGGADDKTRWTMLRMLRVCGSGDPQEESHLLSKCLGRFQREGTRGAEDGGQAARRICCALQIIEPYEQIYQCATMLFDQIRLVAGRQGQANLRELALLPKIKDASTKLQSAAAQFVKMIEAASDASDGLGPARQVFVKLKIRELAKLFAATRKPIEQCQTVVRRHLEVQSNKLDGGRPKQAWVEFDKGGHMFAKLTAQRFALETSQSTESWTDVPRHSYRTAGAARFIEQCGIK